MIKNTKPAKLDDLQCEECAVTFNSDDAASVISFVGALFRVIRCPNCDCGDLKHYPKRTLQ